MKSRQGLQRIAGNLIVFRADEDGSTSSKPVVLDALGHVKLLSQARSDYAKRDFATAAGRYRLPWEDSVRVTDGTGCGIEAPTRVYGGTVAKAAE